MFFQCLETPAYSVITYHDIPFADMVCQIRSSRGRGALLVLRFYQKVEEE